jgi:hypothetical protein
VCISSPPAACSQQYTVQEGDTCTSIATAAAIPVQQLYSLNPSINEECTNIQIGQLLCLTDSASTQPVSSNPAPPPPPPASPPRPPTSPLPTPPTTVAPAAPPKPVSATCQGLVIATAVPASNPNSLAAMLQVEVMQLLGMNTQLPANEPVPAGTQVRPCKLCYQSRSLYSACVLHWYACGNGWPVDHTSRHCACCQQHPETCCQ